MDGGGRVSGSVARRLGDFAEAIALWRANRSARRRIAPGLHIPRGIGSSAAIFFLLACAGSGFVIGGHYDAVRVSEGSPKDMLARAFGFGIAEIGVSGNVELSAEEVVALSGLPATASLPFLDPKSLQERLADVPMIADASVTKFYPDRLVIAVRERVPFALWQLDGKVNVIAEDGTAIEALTDPRFLRLPHVVGPDANLRVKEFAALIETVPDLKGRIRAGILVSKRRWTLKLDNGVDIKLPETGAEAALKAFAAIERDAALSGRAVLAIDLRLPDRITVRLTEEAAQAHRDAIAEKVKKWGGRA
jgi:cell division protein FtsQ